MTPSPAQNPPKATPLFLGIISLVCGILLLAGALQRTGIYGAAGQSVWQAWLDAGPVVRFVVMLALMGGLFGAGITAMRMTWKRFAYLDLFAAAGFLLAGLGFLVAATANPQYGASQTTAMVIGGMLTAGFIATLLSAGRRLAATKQKRNPQAPASEPDTEPAQTQ